MIYDFFPGYWVQCCTFFSKENIQYIWQKKRTRTMIQMVIKRWLLIRWKPGVEADCCISATSSQHQTPLHTKNPAQKIIFIPANIRYWSHQTVSRASLVIRVHVKLCWSLSLLVHFFWKEGQRRRKGKKKVHHKFLPWTPSLVLGLAKHWAQVSCFLCKELVVLS